MIQEELFEKERAVLEVWPYPHVELLDGVPFVEGTRVPVRRLFDFHKRGTPIATLFQRYPQVERAKILSALAFAYDNEAYVLDDLERSKVS